MESEARSAYALRRREGVAPQIVLIPVRLGKLLLSRVQVQVLDPVVSTGTDPSAWWDERVQLDIQRER